MIGDRPCLCLVTDRRRLSPDARTTRESLVGLERWLDDGRDALPHLDLIQIREPDLDAAVLLALTRRVIELAAGSGAAVIVNDRADVARAASAAGVHLKAAGPPPDRVRRLGGDGWIVGRSAHSVEEMSRTGGADYVLFGTVFATSSKPSGTTLQGVEGLTRAAAAARVPVVAIGGLTPSRARACLAAGAAGVAAIGAFLPRDRAVDGLGLRAAAAAFREALVPAGRFPLR